MMKLTRREFLSAAGKLSVVMGLGSSSIPGIAEALEKMVSGRAPILWLQAQSCSGCSVSMLNAMTPGPAEILTRVVSLLFHSSLSFATGEKGIETVKHAIDKKGYILAVEGSIPKKIPDACIMGGIPIEEWVLRGAKNADAVVSVGSCASFGGIPAAENNQTGAVSVPDYLEEEGIEKPVIRLPGCPVHSEWIAGTLVHLVKFGLPETDELGRPKLFYGRLIHDQCPRFPDYEREHFAKTFSDDGCLFRLGCLGPVTHADCTVRFWNHRTNSCIPAGAPCIGCASEIFARKASLPFYRKNEAVFLEEKTKS